MLLMNSMRHAAAAAALAEPVEGPPAPPGRGGGLTYAQGPHVTYEKKFSSFFLINVFKIFVKIFVHNEIY